MKPKRQKLSWPESIEYHTEHDLSKMLWEKYLRPVGMPEHEGFDATLAIAGDTGMGKSELALLTALSLCKLSGATFDVKQNVVYTREQLEAAIKKLPRYSPIVVDEAVNVLFSRDDQKNSQIIKVLEACRSRNLAILFCMPDFSAMDAKARKSRIRLWVDIRKVGEGVEFIRRRRTASDPHRTDPWNNWAFDQIGSQLERHPNFLGIIRWGRLPEALRAEYVAHKNASELLSEVDEQEEKASDIVGFLATLDNHKKGYDRLVERAAEYFGVHRVTLYNQIKDRKELLLRGNV